MLARSKGFWISTVVFLLVSVGLIWFVLLPMMTSYRATTDEIASTTEQLESKKQFLATVQQLSNDQTSLETTFAAATAALPITTDPENLLIQLYALNFIRNFYKLRAQCNDIICQPVNTDNGRHQFA